MCHPGPSAAKQEEDPEDSDSDGAPEEATISTGKEVAETVDKKIAREVKKRQQLAKEDRKRKQERNIKQKEEKVLY